jgi:autotransporter-associated beta strand protein
MSPMKFGFKTIAPSVSNAARLWICTGIALVISPSGRTAQAQLFVTSSSAQTISAFTTAGTAVGAPLITGLTSPVGLAASGPDLLVSSNLGSGLGTIGSYTSAGSMLNPALIAGLSNANSIAVCGSDVYVANFGANSIGKYSTSGATLNPSLITGLSGPEDIAVSGSNLFVLNLNTKTIGQYTTSGVTGNPSLISGLSSPVAIAVSGTDLYVANYSSGTIGKYTTSGVTVNPSLISGLSGPFGLAVAGSHLYVSNFTTGTIGEYTTSGATVNAPLITGLTGPLRLINATPTWTGSGGDGNWSTAADWTNAAFNGGNLTFAGSTQTSTNNDNLTSAGSITFDENAAPFSLGGNSLAVAGPITNKSANTQVLALPITASVLLQFNAANANLVVNGSIDNGGNVLSVTGSSDTTLSGAISGAGAISKSGTGTLTISGNNSHGGGTTINAGALVVGHAKALGTGPLAINNTATAKLQAGLGAPVQLAGLTINGGSASPTATLDITDNNVVIHNGDLTTLGAQLNSALNAVANDWTRPGITSSTAAANTGVAAAVGAILNKDAAGNPVYTTWPSGGGVTVSDTDVLMKYTYFGDANLDGIVDNTTDYDLWSTGFIHPDLAAAKGWLYGDFDYNGIVDNTTDYDLWAMGFSHQGNPAVITMTSFVQPVPEPGAIVLGTITAALGIAWAALKMRKAVQKNS